jgi:putative ABC transport system permease protein
MEFFLPDLKQDLKHSGRMLWRSPAFTNAAIGALALGIGTNTAIFSVVNAVLLRPLPYPGADRMVTFLNTAPTGPYYPASIMKFVFLRRQSSVFEDVCAFRNGTAALEGIGYPETVPSTTATAEFFRAFGSFPIASGRTFTAEEDRPGGNRVAVISDRLWKRRFGADPRILGQTISLSGKSYRVIGITAPGKGTERDPPTEVWMPLQLDPNSGDQNHYLTVVGRLKPGVSLGMANTQLGFAADEFRREHPGVMPAQQGFKVEPELDAIVGDVRTPLVVLLGAVSLVLLIACANVAHLLLVRASIRKREIAIRLAVGASRGRIVRQLLTEGFVLSAAGGALGFALGMAGVRALLALNPGNIPRIGNHGVLVSVDGRVLTFTLVVSLITTLLSGLVPALQASRPSTGLRSNKTRSLLVVAEMTLALVLLMGAGLLIRTFVALRSVDAGFDRHNVLIVKMSLIGPSFEKTSGVASLARSGLDRLRALPGVVTAATTCCVPLDGNGFLTFDVVGRPRSGTKHEAAAWTQASPGYFDVFKIPVLRGRAFTDRDDGSSAGVVIINQAMARKYWPNGDPLNDRLLIAPGAGPLLEEPARQIVGIVADIRDTAINKEPRPTMYVPTAQVQDGINSTTSGFAQLAWVVRTRAEPHSLSSSIQNELRAASGGLPIASVLSMDEIAAGNTARQDFNMLLLTIFGGCALLLAAIGIYGLMAYSVELRTREIGIRLALGADPTGVRNMIVFHGMRLALAGVGIGVIVSFGLTRFIASFLFGVRPLDPVSFTIAPVMLCGVALLAVWIPARRASRVDPMLALGLAA